MVIGLAGWWFWGPNRWIRAAGCCFLLTSFGGSDPAKLALLGDAPSLNKAVLQSMNGPPFSLFLETDLGGLETRFGTPPTLLPKTPKVVGETLDS